MATGIAAVAVAAVAAIVTASHARCILLPALAVATKHRFPSSHAATSLSIAAIVTSHKEQPAVLVIADLAGSAYE
ncbi:MAG: hypothetical protein NVSMB33_09890 [Ktedonobacteraceae bacterium]